MRFGSSEGVLHGLGVGDPARLFGMTTADGLSGFCDVCRHAPPGGEFVAQSRCRLARGERGCGLVIPTSGARRNLLCAVSLHRGMRDPLPAAWCSIAPACFGVGDPSRAFGMTYRGAMLLSRCHRSTLLSSRRREGGGISCAEVFPGPGRSLAFARDDRWGRGVEDGGGRRR